MTYTFGTAPLGSSNRQPSLVAKERRMHDKALQDFGRQVRSAARILWRGTGTLVDFVDTLNGAIMRGYEQAWQEGAKACNILPGDRTLQESVTLNQQLAIAQSRILPLAEFIEERSRANGGKWGDLQTRLKVWTQRYNEVREIAKGMACADLKGKWIYGDTVKHCASCSKVVGRVYRMSVWDKYGWIPGSRQLACGGWQCDCKRQPTDEPVTPGRPPNLP